LRPDAEKDPNYQYDLPYLEDSEAIQIGFMQLIHAVGQDRIPAHRAKPILSALHGASANLRAMNKLARQCEAGSVPKPKKQPAGVGAPDQRAEQSA